MRAERIGALGNVADVVLGEAAVVAERLRTGHLDDAVQSVVLELGDAALGAVTSKEASTTLTEGGSEIEGCSPDPDDKELDSLYLDDLQSLVWMAQDSEENLEELRAIHSRIRASRFSEWKLAEDRNKLRLDEIREEHGYPTITSFMEASG
ncbi:MAG: hypothetical protein AAFX50_25535, partial [Acidobacteriota bacterium]